MAEHLRLANLDAVQLDRSAPRGAEFVEWYEGVHDVLATGATAVDRFSILAVGAAGGSPEDL